ncbi:transporter [Vibrio sp. JC009]|uniref:transporter n=1 Tax=Vibrio sp. JC009 TaxID=2912314 RepID=UPI0023AF4D65|nr:transporter [Vibrio sp. JC009]WED23846.1 transporter [Vibrio sp. JC009]
MKKLIIASAVVSALAFNAYAAEETSQKAKQMKMPAGPVHGSTGMVFPEGKLATNLKTVFVEKSDLYSGNDTITNSANKEMTSLKSNAIIRYGLGSNFDVRMLVPYVDKSMSTKMADYDNSGLGDVRVLARYQLTSPALGDSFFSTVGIGVELPTGSTDKDNLSDGLQNGDGSTDPIIEVGITKPLPNSRIDFSAMYIFNQEGDNNYEKGDQLTYNLGYSYLVHPKFMPSIELNGTLADENVKNGTEAVNSGGHEIFLTPGFSSGITKKFKLFAGVGIPVYRDYNDSTAGTLGTDYRVTTKLSYAW